MKKIFNCVTNIREIIYSNIFMELLVEKLNQTILELRGDQGELPLTPRIKKSGFTSP